MATHSEVAHRWAQDDPHARTISGFNMFFERRRAYGSFFKDGSEEQVIFSHGRHFPIAAFQTTKRGERVVLYNDESRSISTSAHQRETLRAIPSRYRVFTVPFVSPAHKPGGSENFHRDNLNALLERAAEAHKKSKRARVYKEDHIKRALASLDMAAQYAQAFGIRWKRPDLDKLTDELERQRRAAEAQYRKERAEREKREAERLAALHVEQEAEFKAWLAGDTWRVPSTWTIDANGNDYVRRFRDGERDELQTSQGAAVPWAHAVKAFRFIRLCRERGEAWHRNGRVIRVGHYQIDAIDTEGNMTAGCHRFAWEHMEALARREGVFEEATPSAEAVEVRS